MGKQRAGDEQHEQLAGEQSKKVWWDHREKFLAEFLIGFLMRFMITKKGPQRTCRCEPFEKVSSYYGLLVAVVKACCCVWHGVEVRGGVRHRVDVIAVTDIVSMGRRMGHVVNVR